MERYNNENRIFSQTGEGAVKGVSKQQPDFCTARKRDRFAAPRVISCVQERGT